MPLPQLPLLLLLTLMTQRMRDGAQVANTTSNDVTSRRAWAWGHVFTQPADFRVGTNVNCEYLTVQSGKF